MSLAEDVEAFLRERRLLGQSRGYIASARRTLDVLIQLLLDQRRPAEASAVTREDLVAALDTLSSRGLSDGSLHVATCALRVFFRWLERKGRLLLDPAQGLRGPRVVHRIGYVPTIAEVRRLLAAPDPGTPEGLRERTILELLYGSGLRISEVRNLDVRDIDLSDRTVFIRSGKGNKDRLVPMTTAAAEAIARYLRYGRPSSTSSALLLSSVTTRRLALDSWYRASYYPLLERARLPRAITPHRLRHACALHLLENGASIRMIQRLLGHASIQTTEVYLALDIASLRRVIARSHPRERGRKRADDE